MNGNYGKFASLHPLPAALHLLFVIFITMFSQDPIVLAVSFACGAAFLCTLQPAKRSLSDFGFYLSLFVLITVTNPLFSHDGVTPLFFMNGNPVTLEAVLYGADIAAMMISVLIWCKCFSVIMTTDKILFLIGGAAEKLSLVLSMSLRFIPLMKRKWRQIKNAQVALGYYSEKGLVAKLTSSFRVFSALVGLSLENAAESGMAMRARGYGVGKRTNYKLYKFTAGDVIFTAFTIVFAAFSIFGMIKGAFSFDFYPRVSACVVTTSDAWFILAFAALSFAPFIFEITEALKWKYLRSKI